MNSAIGVYQRTHFGVYQFLSLQTYKLVNIFKFKFLDKILIDEEIISHVSKIFKNNGGSDAWYSLPISELLPKRHRDKASKLKKGD